MHSDQVIKDQQAIDLKTQQQIADSISSISRTCSDFRAFNVSDIIKKIDLFNNNFGKITISIERISFALQSIAKSYETMITDPQKQK